MLQSVTLTPAEAHLLKVEEERFRQASEEAKTRLQSAIKAVYLAHGWEYGVLKGQMQRDPLDPDTVRFVYDDGVEAPTTGGDAQPEADKDLKVLDFPLQHAAGT